MDPIAHTLTGAALAETGLKRTTRLATATLIIGANLPDIDVIATLWGSDHMLYWRRGWTHGVLAMAVLPLLLTALMMLWHRWHPPKTDSAPDLNAGRLLLLSYLAVLSHPLLDWLNTYGVRLLMPFDGRWFYGDTLFIIDPWIWLVAGTVLVPGQWHVLWVRIAGMVLALAGTALVWATDLTPLPVKYAWLIGLTAAVALIWRLKTAPQHHGASAASALAILALYIGATHWFARDAENQALNQHQALTVQANPVPGTPGLHRLIVVHQDHYQLITHHGDQFQVDRIDSHPLVDQALSSPSVRGFVNWMRFPYYELEQTDEGVTVHIRDLRYQGPDEPGAGIGHTWVDLPGARLSP